MKYSKLNIFYFLCILFAFSVVSYELIFLNKYINDISNSKAIFQESNILTELYQLNIEIFRTEQTNVSEKKIILLWFQMVEIFACLLISIIFISKRIRKIIFKRFNDENRREISFLTLKKAEILYFSLFIFFIFISKSINYLLYYKKMGFEIKILASQINQLIYEIIFLPFIRLLIASLFLKYWKRRYIYFFILTIILLKYINKSFAEIGDPTIAGYNRLDIKNLDDKIQEVITKLNLKNDIYIRQKDRFFINAFFALNFREKFIILDGEIFKQKRYIQGILSHELGHATDRISILVANFIVETLFCIFILFFVDCFISKYFIDENVSRDCSSAILFLLYFCYFYVCLKPIGNIFSQIFEFRADMFAKSLSQQIPLAEALFLISIDLNPFVSSKIYTIFLYTHPSIYDRLKNFDRN